MHLPKRRRYDQNAAQGASRGASAHQRYHVQPSINDRDLFHGAMDAAHECSKGEPIPTSFDPPFSEVLESLNQIGIIDLLDQDLRPTFIIDLESMVSQQERILRPVYCNPLLHTSRSLQELVLGTACVLINKEGADEGIDEAYREFVSWASQPVAAQARDASLLSLVYKGICWTTSTLRDRWRVVAGNNYALLPEESENAHTPSFLGHKRVEIHKSYTDRGLDIDGLVRLREGQFGKETCWTTSEEHPNLSAHLQLIYNTDWTASPFGAMETWSPQLRVIISILIAEPIPTILFWGQENALIYNETYVQFLGEKHPRAMGSTAETTFPEIWDHLKGMLENGKHTSHPIRVDGIPFTLHRKGFFEETYFDSTFLPLIGQDGSVLGFHESVLETTTQVFSRRRHETLTQLDTLVCEMQSVDEFWKEVTGVVKQNPLDMPFALCFSPGADPNDSSRELLWEANSGLTPELLVSQRGKHDLNRLLVMSLENIGRNQQVLNLKEAGFSKVAEAINVERAVVSSVPHIANSESAGIIIIGLSPRQAYDIEYKTFIENFLSKLDTSFRAVETRLRELIERQEEERKRMVEKAHLAEELRLRTEEARANERRFERLAESAPVGIWVSNTDGTFTFRNAEWFEITGHSRDDAVPFSWMNIIHEDDQTKLLEIWKKIAEQRETLSFELKLKRSWDGAGSQKVSVAAGAQHAWILCSLHPDQYFEDGSIKSFVGCVSEISHLKWAEGEQARRKEEALKSKRQQEAFVDMVSHEIRNPLAAIIQSADGIITSLESSDNADVCQKDIVDSAQIIITCAQHQKRIVDDILSMSKLDSDLLSITPVNAKPIAIAQQAFTMLNSEAKSAGITMELNPEPSYTQLRVDYVLLDPSRLTQVLINLITNAIKFTKFQPKRSVMVKVGASLSKPCSEDSSEKITYVPAKSPQQDVLCGADWGDGEALFISFSVQDTGRGLNTEEKKLLFQRFSQASPKTHVQYGGSGLGLFISRTLVEKQGGEIGVASESGVGSIFAFFIRVRRGASPESSMPDREQTSNSGMNPTPTTNGTEHHEQKYESNCSHTNPPLLKQPKPPPSPLELNILITEDNLINQTVLRKQLLPHCAQIFLANHGLEALAYLRSSTRWTDHPQLKTSHSDIASLPAPAQNPNQKIPSGEKFKIDVILMDQEMPQMDGLTCVKRIRELEKEGLLIGRVPVIGITANARRRQVEGLVEAGMDDVVLKPFRVGDLVGRIGGVVGRFDDDGVGG